MSAALPTLARWTGAALAAQDAPPAPAWLPEVFSRPMLGLALWQYAAIAAALFVALLLRKIVTWLVREKLKALFAKAGGRWMEAAVVALDRPIGVLAMGAVFWVATPLLDLPAGVQRVLALAIEVLLSFGIVWALYRLVDVLADVMAEKAGQTDTKLDDQLVPLVRKTLKVFLVLIGAIFVLQNLDVDVGSALAGLGIGGLAFALAAKDTLANLFGSLMIFTDRPFQIGDWVIVGGAEGTVEEVGFRSTRIRTFYNSLITVPNQKIADTIVDNMGMRRYRRIKQMLGLEYGTTPEQMDAFCDGVRAIIKAHPATRKDFYLVYFTEFADFSLNVLLYAFVEVPDWQAELEAKHQIYLEIIRLAKRLGVSFAFPTRTLHMATQAAPKDLPAPLVPADPDLAGVVHAFGPGGALSRPGGPRLTHGYLAGAHVARGDADAGE